MSRRTVEWWNRHAAAIRYSGRYFTAHLAAAQVHATLAVAAGGTS